MSLLRKERLNKKLRAFNPPSQNLGLFLKGVFSILQEEVEFGLGWFFPVNPGTMKRTDDCFQIWSGSSFQIETVPLSLDDRLFPSVACLQEKENVAIRGEACWSNAQLMNHALYQKILKPDGLFFSFISLLFDRDKKCIGYLVLWKKRGNGRFSDKDYGLLTSILPEIGALLQDRSNGVGDESTSPRSGNHLFHPMEKISGIGEEELYSLIRRREQPGILILDQAGSILYLNRDATLFLEGLMTQSRPVASNGVDQNDLGVDQMKEKVSSKIGANGSRLLLPEMVYQLYDYFSKMIASRGAPIEEAMPTVNRICIHNEVVYLLRALLLRQHGTSPDIDYFMILIEKVSKGVRVDQIDWTTKLTPRESEVVHLLLEGKTNKEVAVCIDIGEYTVKDHIKRIMKKLQVTTRAGIVAKVLQHHFPS